MLRFTKRADYGLMAIHYIAIHDERAVSAKRIAEEFSIPQELLAKILQRLAKQGLIVSQNGPKGGYVLTRRPAEISVGEVIRALEGPIVPMICANEDPIHALDCGRTGFCTVNLMWVRVREAIVSTLESLTLAEVSRGLPPAHRTSAHPDLVVASADLTTPTVPRPA